MPSAPTNGNAGAGRYGRYVLCIQVGDSSGTFAEPVFLGVLDLHGHVSEGTINEYRG